MIDLILTPEEKRAIAALRRLGKRWPKTLWVFTGGDGSTMSIMKYDEHGLRARTSGGSVDKEYIVGSVEFDIEGGGW